MERLGHEAGRHVGPGRARRSAERLILPGVGAFGDGMRNLAARACRAPHRLVLEQGKPILGICLGAQLMARDSEEFGGHEGLGWIDASVRPSRARHPRSGFLMSAGTSCTRRRERAVRGVPDHSLFYYVHSFHIQVHDPRSCGHLPVRSRAHGRVRARQHLRHAVPSRRRASSHGLDAARQLPRRRRLTMLRTRLITVLTLNDGVLFRTKRFHPDYRYTMNFVDAWSIDEIVALDVTRSRARRPRALLRGRPGAGAPLLRSACLRRRHPHGRGRRHPVSHRRGQDRPQHGRGGATGARHGARPPLRSAEHRRLDRRAAPR